MSPIREAEHQAYIRIIHRLLERLGGTVIFERWELDPACDHGRVGFPVVQHLYDPTGTTRIVLRLRSEPPVRVPPARAPAEEPLPVHLL